MAFRKDKKLKLVGFSPEEWELICEKAEKAKMRTGTYVRTVAVQGEIKIYDMSQTVNLMRAFNAIGTNLNQIAKVANSTGEVYKNDIDEMKEQFEYFQGVMENYLQELLPREILR